MVVNRNSFALLASNPSKNVIFQGRRSSCVSWIVSFFPLTHAFMDCWRGWENWIGFCFFSFPALRGENLARAECLLIPTIGNLTFSFCFSPSLIFTQPKVGVCPPRMIQQSHPVVTKACLRAPVEIEMSQAHLFSKAMKSWSGHSPKHDFSDSKWHCPWPLALPRWGALVEGGLHQVSKRGYRAPGLGVSSRSMEHFLTGAALWFWQRPGLHGDEETDKMTHLGSEPRKCMLMLACRQK